VSSFVSTNDAWPIHSSEIGQQANVEIGVEVSSFAR